MSLINRATVKRFALEHVQRTRAGKFTRVSKDFLDRMERLLKANVENAVRQQPSVGKTLQ